MAVPVRRVLAYDVVEHANEEKEYRPYQDGALPEDPGRDQGILSAPILHEDENGGHESEPNEQSYDL